jgi:hypothetical protein
VGFTAVFWFSNARQDCLTNEQLTSPPDHSKYFVDETVLRSFLLHPTGVCNTHCRFAEIWTSKNISSTILSDPEGRYFSQIATH